MISSKEKDILTERARKALNKLWNSAFLQGRCWGKKFRGGVNPFLGSNITIAEEEELVSVSVDSNGFLVVHEFKRATGTLLGDRVKEALSKNNLKTKDGP